MLNLPIGSRVAASYATCVAPKSLPSFAYFVHGLFLRRSARLSAFWIRMFNAHSFPNVFRRVADPVEPFGFKLVKNELPPPLLTGIGERPGKQPGLFDQVDESQTNELQRV